MKRLLVSLALLLFLTPAWAAIPTFVGYTNPKASTSTITPTIHASTLTNDILLFIIETDEEDITGVSGGSETWTELVESPKNTTGTRLEVWWARASQDTPTPPTSAPDVSDHVMGTIMTFRGVITTGDPWDVTSGNVESTSDTSGSIDGDTTTVADCLIVGIVAHSLPDSSTNLNGSGWTNGDLASVTEIVDNARNQGNGGWLGAVTGEKASAGSYGATTYTVANAATKGMMTIALKPPAAPGARRVMVVD